MRKRLRYRDLVALGVVANRITLRAWIRDYGFPRGQLIGPNTRVWEEDAVEAWIASRPIGPKDTPFTHTADDPQEQAARAPRKTA